MHATIERQEKPIHLAKPTDASLEAGAKLYRTDCAVCHGLPDQAPTPTAEGMYPRPPQFFRPHARKIDDPPGQVYWKVENGIRLTGMPAWRGSLSGAQARRITAFLEDGPSLPAPVTAVLEATPAKEKQKTKSKAGRLPRRG
jgi:mono/diheme cytochrome c family protein